MRFSKDAGLIVPPVLRALLLTAFGLALFVLYLFDDNATGQEMRGLNNIPR